MSKGRIYESYNPINPPDWYWVNGLHDACIVDVEEYDFPFDYKQYAVDKSNYSRNQLSLKIKASNALLDSSVREIKFFNYKVLSSNIKLQGRDKVWWLADRLTEQDGQYYLEIDLQDFDAFPEEFTWKISFDRAEVIRSK